MTAGPSGNPPESADVREVRATLKRAVRRLNVLELILLGAAVIAALAGGWLAALLGTRAFDMPFRATWVTASITFFIVPALLALGIERFKRSAARRAGDTTDDHASGGDGI